MRKREEVSLGQVLQAGRNLLAHTATGRKDAEWLLRAATGLSAARILTHPELEIDEWDVEIYRSWVERRAQNEPVQYILGTQEFFGLKFEVTPAVLIPRPETEHLVEAALEIAGAMPAGLMMDIGTGSGAIAVSFASRMAEWKVTATDISAEALAVARRNAAAQGVSDRVQFIECDLFPEGDRESAMICSNPPYVPRGEVLEPQVARFEPHAALFAGDDGMDVYRRLIPMAAQALLPGGSLLLEIGHGQAAEIESLLAASELKAVRFVPDLQGIPRIAIALQQ